MGALTKIFGTHSERELKRIYPLVDKVESYRDSMQKLSDEELRNKTKEYKERLEKGETLDDLLPEAFATVREAAKRVLVPSGLEDGENEVVYFVFRSALCYPALYHSSPGTYCRDEDR